MLVRSSILGNALAAKSRCLSQVEKRYVISDTERKGDARSLHAVFSTLNPRRSIITSLMMNFCILPVTVIGNSSTNSM